jgi:HAD superfamily hydrolase (TIGR01509 family)
MEKTKGLAATGEEVGLVILDCDGVLVDSEAISSRVLSTMLAEAGLAVSPDEVNIHFLGPRLKDVVTEVEAIIGKKLGDPWIQEFETRRAKILEAELLPISGAHDALSCLVDRDIPICVASQARLEATHRKLGLTGLSKFVPRHAVFSADEVPYGKPHPGVFLHAAQSMGVEPEQCVVVEDSARGVTAALRAGMRVFEYPGRSGAGVEGSPQPLSSLGNLPRLLGLI